MRTTYCRSFNNRLKILVALLVLVSGGMPALTTWAQDSGAASFTIGSSNGNVVIKRANGDSEMARPGVTLMSGDQLASVGRSEATVNLGNQSSGSGATLFLFTDTTIGVRSPGAGGGGFFVADIASGVVLARSLPSSNATIQITNETAGAVAQLNPGGGMAVASDVGTGTIAVGCDDKTSQVFFPYVDSRVPCENNVVRTLSNQRTVDDSTADSNSPVTSVVQAAGTNVAAVQQQGNQTQAQHAASQEKEKESSTQSVVASPVPVPVVAAPCGQLFSFIDTTRTANVLIELGRSSGTISVSIDGGGSLADTFDLVYEGRSLSPFPITTAGTRTVFLSYSGVSTQVTMVVTPGPNTNPTNDYFFVVGCPGSSSAASTSDLGASGSERLNP